MIRSFISSYTTLFTCSFIYVFIHQNFSIQQFGASSGRASIASCGSLPPTQVFTTIGIYKGDRVAIKKITKKKVILCVIRSVHQTRHDVQTDEKKFIYDFHNDIKVDITSTLLWEIKQARDVSHENTVRFVGACIDLPRPTILILTEYCPKGRFVVIRV